MTITGLDTDPENLTLTLIADFDAPIDRVWDLWSDPRKIERWWGPPGYPATFEKHDLTPGSDATYFMTSPEGDRPWGAWRVTAVDLPAYLEFKDAFADTDGTPIADAPVMTVRVQLTGRGDGTRMEMRSTFASREDMEKVVKMGAVEGLQQAVGQMDALLAA